MFTSATYYFAITAGSTVYFTSQLRLRLSPLRRAPPVEKRVEQLDYSRERMTLDHVASRRRRRRRDDTKCCR